MSVRSRAFALALLILVLDGVDIQILALVAPSLIHEWGVTRAALGPALSAALIGMAIGAPLGGVLGDRHGRRLVLLASVGVFGLLTLATASVTTIAQLTALRLLVGVGLGGCLPNATALIAEFFPGRFRAVAVVLGIVGVPIGGMAGAAVAGWVLPELGWRALLIAGGALPLALLLLLIPALPESPSYRARPAGRVPDAPHAGWLDRLSAILEPKFRRNTLSLWPAFFASLFVLYCFFNWVPVVLVDAGLSPAAATRGSLAFNLGGIVGGALLAALIGLRLPLKNTVIGAAGAALVVSAVLSTSPWHLAGAVGSGFAEAVALGGLLLAGLAVNGLQIGLYALAAAAYPSDRRATGVGWALGCGRVGAIASAFALGLVFTAGFSVAGYFAGICAMLVLALAALAAFDAAAIVHD